jgi:hypothetical protein
MTFEPIFIQTPSVTMREVRRVKQTMGINSRNIPKSSLSPQTEPIISPYPVHGNAADRTDRVGL